MKKKQKLVASWRSIFDFGAYGKGELADVKKITKAGARRIWPFKKAKK